MSDRSDPEAIRRQRDRTLERTGDRRVDLAFTCKVVGVSFVPAYPDNLVGLDRVADEARQSGEPLVVVLKRNPANEYDANAVEVHVPALGEELGMIGHLTRPIAARLAPEMDSGVEWRAELESILIDPEHPDRPGISIKCAPARKEQ